MFRTPIITALCVALPSIVCAQGTLTQPPYQPATSASPVRVVPVFDPVSASMLPADEPPPFDPNDTELSELWKNIENLQRENTALQAEYSRQSSLLYQKETEAQGIFMHKLGERRIEELQRRRTAEELDVSKPGLTVLNFPEIGGSTSCSNLARLIVCRTLDVPYKWTVQVSRAMQGDYQAANLQIVVDEGKAGARAAHVVETLTGNLGGTHEAYRGLLVKPSNQHLADLPLVATSSADTPALSPLIPARTSEQPEARLPYYGAGQPRVQVTPVELIIVARKPSADELALAKEQNVEFDVRPLALDALVFLVNRRNPVQTLTLDQILEIYDPHDTPLPQGTSQDRRIAIGLLWGKFDGSGSQSGVNILPFERDRNSGSRELMDDFIAEHRKPVPEGKIALRTQPNYFGQPTEAVGMMGPMFSLNTYLGGLAYSVFQYEHFMHLNMNVKTIKINGIAPSSETIADGTYPAITGVFVVTVKGIAEDSPVAKLRDFLLGEEGQRLVYESGHVPVSHAHINEQ